MTGHLVTGLRDFPQYSGNAHILLTCRALTACPLPPIQINHNELLRSKYRLIILPNYALLGRGVKMFAKI